MKAATVGILLIVLLLYFFINELKSNLHGKCVIGFLVSSIVAFSFSRFGFYICDILTMAALSFAFLWINVLIFDVWWTLRWLEIMNTFSQNLQSFVFSYFRSSSGGKFKYSFYFVLISGLIAFGLMVPLNSLFVSFAFTCFAITSCLACFVFALLKIYEMTGEEMDFAQKRFAFEEHR